MFYHHAALVAIPLDSNMNGYKYAITARAEIPDFKHARAFSAVQTSQQKMLCTVKSNKVTKMVQVRYSLNAPLYQEGARIFEVLHSRRDTRSTSPVSAQK